MLFLFINLLRIMFRFIDWLFLVSFCIIVFIWFLEKFIIVILLIILLIDSWFVDKGVVLEDG